MTNPYFKEDFQDTPVDEADAIMESADFSEAQIRSMAMAIAEVWVEEGDYSYDSLENLVEGDADVNDDGVVDDDEEEIYNSLWLAVADTFAEMGVDAEIVQKFIDNENNDAGRKAGMYLSDRLDNETADDDELIGEHAIGNPVMESTNIVPFNRYDPMADNDEMVLESFIKVVRGGKVTLKKKRIGRKKPRTPAQKAALKVTRLKAWKGAAKFSRKRSMKVRKKRGM